MYPELYHLSFNNQLPKILSPRQPVGEDMPRSDYTEKLGKRVSFSPSIQQAFVAIYPNIQNLFEKNKYPYIIMFVYMPTKMVGRIPEEIVLKEVYDAHYTGEVCFNEPVPVIRVAKIEIKSPLPYTKEKDIVIHPFNDKTKKPLFVAPIMEYVVRQMYANVSLK